MRVPMLARTLTAVALATTGCTDAANPIPASTWCHASQAAPYAKQSTFPGLHGGAQNWNRVPCTGPSAVTRSWTALEGLIVFQPVTISADGRELYATVARSGAADCKIYAVATSDGTARCLGASAFTLGVSGSSVEVDAAGFLYVTDGYDDGHEAVVVKLDPEDGREIWRTVLPNLGTAEGSEPAPYRTPAGLHFTRDGYVVTVTVDGVVVLLARDTGAIVASLPLQTATGLRPTPASDDHARLPPYLEANIGKAVGALSQSDLDYIFAASLGESGSFADNTVGVASTGQLFLTAPGRAADEGALLAVDVTSGHPPTLSFIWAMYFPLGSATSPVVSPDGRRVVVGDNDANVHYVYVDDCNANADADSDPRICAPKWSYALAARPLLGAPAMDENGVVYAWNTTSDAGVPDLLAIADRDGEPEVLWDRNFTPEGGTNRVWSSAVTVLDNHVIGTVTNMVRATQLSDDMPPIVLEASHAAVAVDRTTGAVAWQIDVPDDAINSLLMGPDGSIYVPELGMLDLSSPNEAQTFTGGIVRLAPVVTE